MRARFGHDALLPAAAAGRAAFHALGGTLPSALAASIAIHVSAFLAAAAIAAWPHSEPVDAADGGPRALRVVLAPPAASAEPSPATARTVAVKSDTALRPAPAAGAEARTSAAPPPTDRGARTGAKGAGEPRVTVDDQVPRARFGDALDGEALAGIPTEIDIPARLPGRLVVPYPPDALAARREGTVLAWSIVDETGTAEEPHVVEGPPEFAEAVTAAFRAARFVPAREGGVPVRFYVMLQFDFRIEARAAVAARAGGPAAR